MVGSDPVQQLPVGPSRRTLLVGGAAAGGALLVAGCTEPDEPPGPPPPPHPDLVLADEAAARERRLLDAYDLALRRRPDLAGLLGPLRAEHAEHLAALDVPEPQATTTATTPSPASAPPSPDGTATTSPPPPPLLPDDPAAAVPALADLERSTAAAHAGAVVRAGRGLAVVLASAAASESSHAVALL